MQSAVKLASLRVSPELDNSRYVGPAGQIEAATEGMSRAAIGAGNAMQQMTPKVSEAGNIVGRLSHQYIDGYGSAVRFQKGLDNLQRAIETGNVEMRQAEAILEGMHRRLGILANAEDLAAAGQLELAAAAANVNTKIAAQEAVATTAAGAQRMLGDATRMAAMQQRNLVFQLNDVAVSLASGMNPMMVFMQQGSQIATIYGPGEGGLGRALQETGNLALGLVSKFWPLAAVIGLGSAAIAGMTHEINKGQQQQVSFTDVMVAGWELISEAIWRALSPVTGWLNKLWNDTAPVLVDIGNDIISTFVAAYNVVTSGWSNLPTVFSAIGKQAYNSLLAEFEKPLLTFGDQVVIPGMNLSGMKAPLTDTEKGVWQGTVGDAFGQDYIRGALGDRAREVSTRDDEPGKLSGIGSAAAAANDNYKSLLSTIEEGKAVFESTQSPIEQMHGELERLQHLLDSKSITMETYNRAVSNAMTSAAAATLSSVGQMTGMLAQAFEDNKAFAIANAVVKGGEAVVSSYAAGANIGGPVGGAIFAGIAAAATAKQIADIASSTKDSKSLAGGGASSASPSVPPAAAPTGGRSLSVSIHGDYHSSSSVRDLVEQIAEYFGDRDLKLNLSHQ